ncbi:TetR/AcrR family transcriptional regulator [Dactylosporangium sp. CA-092794]|uniref:TetR/AcrR family transcriptional regulator n=1 Tax=Dactylosporangium sp. CA-092794 TaxID=3239929 RepID=UPI003D92D68C
MSRNVRRDAAHNRARMLASARRLGPAAGAREVAREAGVSAATLYRHFPTLRQLFSEVYAEQAAACGDALARAVTDPDPARGIRGFVRHAFAVQAAEPGFVAAFHRFSAAAPDRAEGRERFAGELAGLVARARDAGAVGPGVTASDLLLVLAAHGGLMAGPAAQRLARSRRLADIALAGLGLAEG